MIPDTLPAPPISFVGSSLDELSRWELTNETHPESDKRTFHNYIVEMDLEKLTKENKQGQGKEEMNAPF